MDLISSIIAGQDLVSDIVKGGGVININTIALQIFLTNHPSVLFNIEWTKWFFVWVPRYCIELRNKAKQGGGAALGGLKDGLAGLGGKIKLKEKLNCKKQCKSCVKSMKGCFEYVKNPKKCCGKKQKDEKQKDKAAKGDEEDNTKLQDNGNGKTAEANGKQN